MEVSLLTTLFLALAYHGKHYKRGDRIQLDPADGSFYNATHTVVLLFRSKHETQFLLHVQYYQPA